MAGARIVIGGVAPRRIICMTAETTETLYLLGEQARIAGISGYTTRPRQARREKPKISGFTTANLDRIRALEPDLILGFSDLQADFLSILSREGYAVHLFDQRTVEGIFAMIATLGTMVDAQARAHALMSELRAHLGAVISSAERLPRRPKIYFEEWGDPLISGIGWVSELIGIAGGEDCFAELAREGLAKNRIIADPNEVIARAPDIIIGSWCGKRFQSDKVRARPGWHAVPAVLHGQLFEIKSADILQPGPAALVDGLKQLQAIVCRWANQR